MKHFLVSALLLSGLALAPVAEADPNGLEWRLSGRNDIWYRHPGEREWRRAPGSATDLGDGWVIGTDRRNGGYGIYRWNGYGWIRTTGAGVKIGGSYHNPWVVNDRGERFTWNGYSWREEPRRGNDRNDRGRRDNDWNNGRRNDRNNDRNEGRNNGRRDNDWNNGRQDNERNSDGFWRSERDGRDGFWSNGRVESARERDRGNDRDEGRNRDNARNR